MSEDLCKNYYSHLYFTVVTFLAKIQNWCYKTTKKLVKPQLWKNLDGKSHFFYKYDFEFWSGMLIVCFAELVWIGLGAGLAEQHSLYNKFLPKPAKDQMEFTISYLTDSFFSNWCNDNPDQIVKPNCFGSRGSTRFSYTLRFFIKFVSRADSSNIYRPTKWPRKQNM